MTNITMTCQVDGQDVWMEMIIIKHLWVMMRC